MYSLFDELLYKRPLSDYYFAKYKSEGKIIVSLLTKEERNYYDAKQYFYVENNQILNIKPMIDYVQPDKDKLTMRQAKKLAKPYLISFKDDITIGQ